MDTKHILQMTYNNIFNTNTLFYSSLFYGTLGGTLTWNLNHLTNGFFYLSIQSIIASAITLIPYYFIRNSVMNLKKPATESSDEYHLFYLSKLAYVILFLSMPIASSLLAKLFFKTKLLPILFCQLLGLGVILGLGIIIDATLTFFNSHQHKIKNLELLNTNKQTPI